MNFPKNTNYYTRFFFWVMVLLVVPVRLVFTQVSPILIPEIQEVTILGDSVIFNLQEGPFQEPITEQILKENLRIPSRYNSISFRFGTSGVSPDHLFQSYLEGFDDGWGRPSEYPMKEYSNLPPGKYALNVRFVIDGRPSSALTSFEFQILPIFYQSNVAWAIYGVLIILVFVTILKVRTYRFAKDRFRLERIINDRTDELVREKDKSENLLANLLPKGTADEIKLTGKATKRKYEMVTVLFSDIQGFTRLAEQMNPEQLIDELDHFFLHFDTVAEKYNIEKIKTIGDAYMCAGGIPEKNRTNPVEVVLTAIEMQHYMKNLHRQATRKGTNIWDIRMGIHTGSVIAGVVGYKKLSYDIWGDTVNTASRMESSGEVGKINISGSTYELVKEFFICEHRGKMPVKYKGEIDMYFVTDIRPDLKDAKEGLPNEEFFIQLQLLRLQDLEEAILEKLKEELPKDLYFHNIEHAQQVYTQVEVLGRSEGLPDQDLLILKTAGLFHDIGYLKSYEGHEDASCDYAREILPGYRYSRSQIDHVCDLIRVTRHPYQPANLLEEIICDADADYLGRVDFKKMALRQYKEQKAYHKAGSFEEWKSEMMHSIDEHDFFTRNALAFRSVDKEKQKSIILNLQEPA
jgi:class 3 adenylate cyclase